MRTAVCLIGLLALMALPAGCSTKEVGRSDLPMENDFSDCDGWSTDDSEHISLSCENGQYQALYKDTSMSISDYIPRRSDDPVDSVGVEADVTFQTAPGTPGDRLIAAGVGCWISAPNEPAKGYLFAVAPEPSIAILKVDESDKSLEQQFFLRAFVDKDSAVVKEMPAVNRVRGECRHGGATSVELSMWVNGEEVGKATDSSGFFGYEAFGFAMFSSESGTDLRFDNFVAEELD
jgi:hypothetical protein